MRPTMVLARLGVALATGLVAVALGGCSSHATPGPSVSKVDLEKDISQRLKAAGQTPQTVTCKDNLAGEIGKTTRCQVLLSGADSFDLVVTATKIDGETVGYVMVPAASKEQLDRVVAKTVSQTAGVTVDSADCQGGLEGQKGAHTQCEVTAQGAKSRHTVTVTKVEGLMMYFHVQPAPA